jgi:hypothetical protein
MLSYKDRRKIQTELKPQFEFIESLPKDIKTSIILYTENLFTVINTALRDTALREGLATKLSKEHENVLKDIDYAFENVPVLKNSLTVYRKVSNKPPVEMKTPFPNPHSKYYKDKFDEKKMTSIISATYDKGVASRFDIRTDCCILVITVPAGSSVLPIENIFSFKKEREVLLNRKGKYYITGETIEEYEDSKGNYESYTYHITYISENSEKV